MKKEQNKKLVKAYLTESEYQALRKVKLNQGVPYSRQISLALAQSSGKP